MMFLEYDLNVFLQIDKYILTICGLYPLKLLSHKCFYYLGMLVNASLTYSETFSLMVDMVLNINNVGKVSEVLLVFLTTITYACKMTNLFYYKNNLLYVEDLLSTNTFKRLQPQQLKLVKDEMDSISRATKIYRVLCLSTVTSQFAIPLFFRTGNPPLTGWIPFYTDDYFLVVWIYQTLCIINLAHDNVAVDILSYKLFLIIAIQLDILADNLRTIDYNTQGNELKHKKVNGKMRNCIEHYSSIVRLASKIEQTLSKAIFVQFFASVIVIATTGFSIVTVPFLSPVFLFLVFYLCCMMAEIGLYSWYGQKVLTKSSDIGISLYMSNWYESDRKLHPTIRILLERTKRPIMLTAGRIIKLSIATFTTIIRSSYSYFALLEKISSEA